MSPGWIDVSKYQKTNFSVKSSDLNESDHEQHPVGRVGKISNYFL